MNAMQARSALFDLYGDHLRSRGGWAPVAALVRLLAPLGVAAPAVRTAVSRMVRQGWLQPVRLDGGPGCSPRGGRRLDDAATRIYRTQATAGRAPGTSRSLTLSGERSRRDRLRASMTFLGFAQLDDATWIGPRLVGGGRLAVEVEGVRAERFIARHDGDSIGLVRRAWDVEGLGRAYARWLSDAESLVSSAGRDPDDETAFATRSLLVHEWRKFLFLDPGLPRSLLPDDWPGEKSAEFFDSESERLRPGATRFVDSCLTLAP